MATISRRGEYQWRAKIRRSGYPEQSKTFNTKAEAEAWVLDVEGKMDRGIFIDRNALEKTTLFDILNRYEKEITPTKKGEVQEKSKLKILKKSKLSGMSLAVIQTKDIVAYRNERIKEVKAATVEPIVALHGNRGGQLDLIACRHQSIDEPVPVIGGFHHHPGSSALCGSSIPTILLRSFGQRCLARTLPISSVITTTLLLMQVYATESHFGLLE